MARRAEALITLGPSRLIVLVVASKLASSISGICLMQTAILSTAIILVPTRLVERAAAMQQSAKTAYRRRSDQVVSRCGFSPTRGRRRALPVCAGDRFRGERGCFDANRIAGAECDRDAVRARRRSRGGRRFAILRLPAAGARAAARRFFSDAESGGDHRAPPHAGGRA